MSGTCLGTIIIDDGPPFGVGSHLCEPLKFKIINVVTF